LIETGARRSQPNVDNRLAAARRIRPSQLRQGQFRPKMQAMNDIVFDRRPRHDAAAPPDPLESLCRIIGRVANGRPPACCECHLALVFFALELTAGRGSSRRNGRRPGATIVLQTRAIFGGLPMENRRDEDSAASATGGVIVGSDGQKKAWITPSFRRLDGRSAGAGAPMSSDLVTGTHTS
jgi:hypothetical protein